MDKAEPRLHGQNNQSEGMPRREQMKVKFNLSKSDLLCFISNKSRSNEQGQQQREDLNPQQINHDIQKSQSQKLFELNRSSNFRSKALGSSIFDNKVMMMNYEQDELYIDSTRSKSKQNSCERQHKNQISEEEDQFLESCVRVITEETDYSSNPVSARFSIPQAYPYLGMQEKTRNRRSISRQENCMFKIELERIERDGRTTIMLRNIPNKYTRDMILGEIDACFKKKYDFFYLPLDYRNQCNVGYAFINFIHTKFIREFYDRFHLTKWQKFNSEKICHVCYARIQGTAQLIHHFKDSTVINQKDKKLRPLIDMNYENLAEMVQRQKQGWA